VKWNIARLIVLMSLSISMRPAAHGQVASIASKHHYVRYRLVDLGTFGGPQSYISDGADITAVRLLNHQGNVTGWADTSVSDPFTDFCWDGDCLVGHGFIGGQRGKKDLGVLSGGASSDTTWITDNGLISGDSQNGEIDPLIPGFPEIRAVLWQHDHLLDLGTLDGGYESISMSVNNRGQVVGLATNGVADPKSLVGVGYQTRAFVWEHGAMRDLGTLGSGTDAMAVLINESGQVVGWSYTDSNPSEICAALYGLPLSTGSFLWEEDRGMTDLGGLGGSCTVAAGINDGGQVVGQSWLHGDMTGHAFRWDRTNGLTDLGTLTGDFSSAHAINNQGQAVGGSYLSDNVRIHAALWKGSAVVDLGSVDADACSYALSINENVQVVGISGSTNCETKRAFLWEPGGRMVDLNSLISSDSDIYVTLASQINNRGEIVGLGVLPNGDERAVLLVPCRDDDQACATKATGRASEGGTILGPPKEAPSTGTSRARFPTLLRGPSSQSVAPGLISAPVSSPHATITDYSLDDEMAMRDRAEVASSIGALTTPVNSCPAMRCSLNHTSGQACGARLCSIPGVVMTIWKGYDRVYKRACFYGC
jgi:probable HAF family extracellular repeat protein